MKSEASVLVGCRVAPSHTAWHLLWDLGFAERQAVQGERFRVLAATRGQQDIAGMQIYTPRALRIK